VKGIKSLLTIGFGVSERSPGGGPNEKVRKGPNLRAKSCENAQKKMGKTMGGFWSKKPIQNSKKERGGGV